MDPPGGSDSKASVYNVRDLGLIPGLGRFPGEGNGNPLQYSCLENPMDGGAWCRLLYMGLQRVGYDWATSLHLDFHDSSVAKESAHNARDLISISGLGRSTGEGIGYPLQYSGLENFKSQTQLRDSHFTSPRWEISGNFKTMALNRICEICMENKNKFHSAVGKEWERELSGSFWALARQTDSAKITPSIWIFQSENGECWKDACDIWKLWAANP